MTISYLSLGSNKGDRVGYIQQAAGLLNGIENVALVRTSAFYETEPCDMDTKNWFVNAIIEIKTSLTPQKLLEVCNKIEAQLGRTQACRTRDDRKYSDRTIDIDIVLYGSEIVNDENLTIPHRLFHRRAFTLVPMLELAPEFVHPVLNKTILEIHEELEEPEMVFLYGTRV